MYGSSRTQCDPPIKAIGLRLTSASNWVLHETIENLDESYKTFCGAAIGFYRIPTSKP